jgi:alkylation response protein AidB-like acyl-CoA dehydrogenase
MPIALTSDQTDLAAAVAGFIARHADVGATRAAFGKIASGEPQPSWQALVEQRLHAIHLPESAGGDGAGLTELAVVLEQAAFGLLPGPLLPTVLASHLMATCASTVRLLPRLAAGATAASAVSAEGLRAVRSAQGWRVSGETVPVLGAAGAQVLVLGARADGAGGEAQGDRAVPGDLWFFLDGALLGEAVIIPGEPVDLTRDIATVRLDDLLIRDEQVLPVRTDQVRDVAAALFAAEAAGVARWCQQTGLAYVKVREQFGRTIGSFQAVKHKCARLYARTELLTAAAWDAATAWDASSAIETDPKSDIDRGGQFALAAAAAAVLAPPGAVDIALDTITLLGGIGYTWEHDAHLYWRRAMSLAAILGPKGGWQRRLATLARTTERSPYLRLDDEPEGLRSSVGQQLDQAAGIEDPAERRRFLAAHGLAAPHYPKPYGLAATPVAQVVIAQEFARAGLAQPNSVVGEWALPTILAHGSEEQREFFVAATLRGDIAWCQLFSEPGAGSDLASLRTRATRAARATKSDGSDGAEEGWVINGQKVWTSQAREADWAICLARTDPEAPKHKGISYFLVDMRGPGVDVRPLREANGNYMFNEVFLTDVFVPDSRLVGAPGDGWRLARTTLGNERVNIATGSASAGTGQRHRLPASFLNDLPAAAGPAGPITDEVLAEAGALTAEALAFAAMSQRLLLRQIAGLRPGPEASVLKVISAANAASVRRALLDWHGGAAAVLGGPADSYLSVPAQLIGGGTVEIQLNVIGEQVLGLPRS